MKYHARYYYGDTNPNAGSGYEKNTGPSETVPDQTLTIQEIYDRFARGLPLAGVRKATYMDPNEDPEDALPELVGQKIDQMETYMSMKEEYDETIKRLAKDIKYPKKTPPEASGISGDKPEKSA